MKNSKKMLAAVALGMLVVSGFAITSAAIDDSAKLDRLSYGVFKDVKNNPFNLIKGENLALPSNFDYIEEMNKEFTNADDKKVSYIPGDALKEAEE